MFDLIKKHPYLTIAAILNLLVAIFFPLEIAFTLALTATGFVVYGLGSLFVGFINRAFFSEETSFETTNSALRDNEKDQAVQNEALTERLQDLLERLTECGITLCRYVAPVIASDLYIYDNTIDAYKGLIANRQGSSYTRQPFLSTPFPFSFVKLQNLCTALNNPNTTTDETIHKLLSLAVCPVTNKIMTDPKIAHLEHHDHSNNEHDFVLVCDQTALDALTANMGVSLVSRVDWTALRNITTDPLLGPRLESTLAAAPIQPKNNMTDAWRAAYAETKVNFRANGAAASQGMANYLFSFFYRGDANNHTTEASNPENIYRPN
jgi:hypothetical protein